MILLDSPDRASLILTVSWFISWSVRICIAQVTEVEVFEGDNVTLSVPWNESSASVLWRWYVTDASHVDNLVAVCLEADQCLYFPPLDPDTALLDHISGNLTIYNTVLTQDLTHQHLYIVKGDDAEAEVNLTINVVPGDPGISGDDWAIAEEAYGARCEVRRVKPASEDMISWSLDNDTDLGHGLTSLRVQPDTTVSVTSSLNYTFDRLPNITSLKCTASYGLQETHTVHHITVCWPPDGTVVSQTDVTEEPIPGQSMGLSCSFSGGNPADTTALFRWTKNNQNLTDENKYEDLYSSQLTVTDLNSSDSGVYRCLVSNCGGEVAVSSTAGYNLTVYFPHGVKILGTEPDEVIEGQTEVQILCLAEGGYPNQSLEVQWTLDGHPVSSVSPGHFLSAYNITSVNKTHSGHYSCHVMNFNDTLGWAASEPYYLDVKYPPLWAGERQFVEGYLQEKKVEINCSVESNPSPHNFTWAFAGAGLRPGIEVREEGLIILDEVTDADFGNYSCVVSNGLVLDGTAMDSAFWISLEEVAPPGLDLWVIISASVGGGLLLILIVTMATCFIKRRYGKSSGSMETDDRDTGEMDSAVMSEGQMNPAMDMQGLGRSYEHLHGISRTTPMDYTHLEQIPANMTSEYDDVDRCSVVLPTAVNKKKKTKKVKKRKKKETPNVDQPTYENMEGKGNQKRKNQKSKKDADQQVPAENLYEILDARGVPQFRSQTDDNIYSNIQPADIYQNIST